MTQNFEHIRKVLTEFGYPEIPNSNGYEWFLKIETYDGYRIIPHYFDCQTNARAKIAAKSLLNKTDVYKVTVFHQMPDGKLDRAISYHAGWTKSTEYEWEWHWNHRRIAI